MPSLHLAGESHTPNELAALIESRVEAARALDAALFELGARATAFLEADDRVEPAMEDLRKLAPMLFGPGIVLDALGVKAPRKKKRRSAGEQRAAWLRELDEPAESRTNGHRRNARRRQRMKPHRNVVVHYVTPAGPERELLERCDELVVNAASGDARALSAVVVTFGEVLLGVARRELGTLWESDAEDVVQETYAALASGALEMEAWGLELGEGLPWLKRVVRELAWEQRAASWREALRPVSPLAEEPGVDAGPRGTLRFIATATDDEVREQFDELVGKAVGGDRRAIGAIAIALGPTLLKEARQALGKGREQEAGNAVQRLFRAMTEGTMTFSGERGTGLAWMKRIVREGARGGSRSAPRLGPAAPGPRRRAASRSSRCLASRLRLRMHEVS